MGQVAEYSLSKLSETLRTMDIPFENVNNPDAATGDILLIVGQSEGNGTASVLLKEGDRSVPAESESLTVWKTRLQNKQTIIVAGYDEKGIMYALLDIAQRIQWSSRSNPMKFVKDVTSKPFVKERGISMYTMHRRLWESRFHSEEFWEGYFDMMANNRLNMLEIFFGYEIGGFMAPIYPYFFDIEGYPEVKIEDITPERQQQNVNAMHRLIALAHERGIGIRLSVWDHLYRGGVQTGGNDDFEYDPERALPWQVTGLEPAGNLIPYTKAALAKFLHTFADIDAILFKTNNESGLRTNELHDFSVGILETFAQASPNLKVDIHTKGLTDTLINTAINLGLNLRLAPKFWMEQLGLPYSPAHINRQDQKNRRHGYADLLRYPQHYQILWKLWNGGTNRVLLWGNPEYVRRFAESSLSYNSDAFVVYEPLATKMATQWHDVEPFQLLNPSYRYYDHEYERYWYFFKTWGLVGYDPNTPEEVWDQEFIKRFGKKTGPILKKALNEASWVLPRIVASNYPYGAFPTTRGWPEKQVLGTLPDFATSEGSDIQLFANFDEEAQLLIANEASFSSAQQNDQETAKLLPSINSVWFKEQSERINKLIRQAENAAGRNQSNEFKSTVTDLKILSNLALYHSRRIPAAVSYRLFVRTNDVAALDKAIEYEKNAIQAWEQIVEAAGDVYAKELLFGMEEHRFGGVTHHLRGHWSDELAYLETGLAELEKRRAEFKPAADIILKAPAYKKASVSENSRYFNISHTRVETSPAGQPVTIRIRVNAPAGIKWVRLQHRAMNQYLDYEMIPMTPTGEKDVFQATIPADRIDTHYDLLYLIEMMNNDGKGFIFPDVNKETPYFVVRLIR